ncbi:uncharacterized protein LOC117638993 [Thrips palmi]|uniref:Uncharacterized protein LOC117638993 n=1 Tax=Thrips palmi TaxID=161013 RepID=A0A6P8XTC1_THRPL|nr:uncharacterized protein LOC117638993 [Thrips palmi]
MWPRACQKSHPKYNHFGQGRTAHGSMQRGKCDFLLVNGQAFALSIEAWFLPGTQSAGLMSAATWASLCVTALLVTSPAQFHPVRTVPAEGLNTRSSVSTVGFPMKIRCSVRRSLNTLRQFRFVE